jgi:hypothetical protein
MNAKKNTIMNPSDFYSKKKYKILMVSIAQNAFRLMY